MTNIKSGVPQMTNQSNKQHYRVSLRNGNNAIEPLTIEQVLQYLSNVYEFGIASSYIVTDINTGKVVLDGAKVLEEDGI